MAMRCVAAFAAYRNGTPVVVHVGDVFADDDPLIQGKEPFFESVDSHLQRRAGVESATAEPGEKRALSRKPAAKRTAG